jgi:ComF family protein
MRSEPAIGDFLKNLLFPSDVYCAACGNLIDGTRPYALCDRCVREIDWLTDGIATCAVCGKALAPHRAGGVCADCREWGRGFDRGLSCCVYAGRARDLVRAMKYRDAAWIARGVADTMADRWAQVIEAGPASPGSPDLVIPVPMTAAKRRKRGYDQAVLVARRLARLIGAPFAGDVLIRERDTAVMSGLGAFERRANMAGAFAMDPYARKLIAAGELDLGDILLVDDVFTTGSTADACAAVLKEAGARAVTLFTFASGADIDGPGRGSDADGFAARHHV